MGREIRSNAKRRGEINDKEGSYEFDILIFSTMVNILRRKKEIYLETGIIKYFAADLFRVTDVREKTGVTGSCKVVAVPLC